MAYLNDRVLDQGLTILNVEATRLDICSQEPTTYGQATGTHSLGNKAGISVGSPEARDGGGRKVVVAAITDGAVTGSGTATHYAITDTNNSRLLATGALDDSQVVTSGNDFRIAAIDIGITEAV